MSSSWNFGISCINVKEQGSTLKNGNWFRVLGLSGIGLNLVKVDPKVNIWSTFVFFDVLDNLCNVNDYLNEFEWF